MASPAIRSGPLAPVLLILGAAAVLAGSTVGMLNGVEPFATWYYQLAWYPTLLAADALVRLRTGRFFLLARPAFTTALFAWSVPFWLFFELLNFRMANWYYVFVPAGTATRWIGIVIAFATVLPAIHLSERVAALGVPGPRQPTTGPGAPAGPAGSAPLGPAGAGSVPRRPWLPALLQAVGAAMVVAALAWPRLLYPLIWGAVTLLLDPVVYRRDRSRSLLADLEDGRWGRPLRLLLGGAFIGLTWELFNSQARGKWIYTVPGLEELKLFEMPVAGFLGFPVLALDGWSGWQTLVVLGLAPPADPADPADPAERPGTGEPGSPAGRRRPSTATRVAVALVAIAFSAAVLRGMERFTISSYAPSLADLPGIEAAPLRDAGYDVFDLADSSPTDVARRTGIPADDAVRAVQRARLATLRGIGTENARALIAVGVGTTEELAATPPDDLIARLRDRTPDARHPARIRVWVRAARSAGLEAEGTVRGPDGR